ncbi:hypothetical protein GN156_28565, partial [bacterium LRH843]|nr:hypothetical protein [bacterium LRH843]
HNKLDMIAHQIALNKLLKMKDAKRGEGQGEVGEIGEGGGEKGEDGEGGEEGQDKEGGEEEEQEGRRRRRSLLENETDDIGIQDKRNNLDMI